MARQFPTLIPKAAYKVDIKTVMTSGAETKTFTNSLFYTQLDANPDPMDAQLTAFLAALTAAVGTLWGACFPGTPASEVSEVKGSYMQDTSTPNVIYGTPNTWTGTRANTDMQPGDSSWFVLKRGQGKGKSSRGGLKMSPILEADTDGYRLKTGSPSLTVNAVALLAALLVPVGYTSGGLTYSWWPMLWSPSKSTLVPAGICVIYGQLWMSGAVRKTLGTMDKRKVRGIY